MNTIILSVFVALFPYMPIFLFVNNVRAETALICTGAIFIITAMNCIFNILSVKRNRWSAKSLSLIGMIVKLIHIPAYVLLFIVGAGGVVFIHLIAVSVIIFIYDCITILLSGNIVLLAILRAKAENRIKTIPAVMFSVSSYVFCIDIITSVLLYFYIKNKEEQRS